MIIKQCEYCGEPFAGGLSKVCRKCSKELDEVFARIRRYMYTADESITITTIVQELDVPEKAVLYLIDSGRLVLEGRLSASNTCRVCGRPSSGGTGMCPQCRQSVGADLEKYKQEQARLRQPKTASDRLGVQPMWTARNKGEQDK